MRIDVDRALGQRPEWELEVVVDGEGYRTNPLTAAQAAELDELLKGNLGWGRIGELLRGILAAPKPDISRWTAEAVGACLTAIVVYWRNYNTRCMESLGNLRDEDDDDGQGYGDGEGPSPRILPRRIRRF